MPISEIEMKSVSRAHLCSPMSSPVSLFLLFSLLLPALILPTTQTHASGLYFPQSDLSLRLPYLAGKEERFEPRGVELITLRALRNDSTEPREAKYRISLPRGHPRPEVSIDQVTNRLVLRALPRKASSTLAIVVLAKDEEGNEATLELAVGPIRVQEKRVDCTDYVQDMCFWSTSRYRIYENQPTTRIGSLGPGVEVYADLCPGFSVTGYKLLNGSEYFDVGDNALLAKAQLDRDVVGPPGGPGPRVAVLVQCVVWERNGTQHAPVRSLEIEVLDQDDNPPTAQGSRSLTRHLGDFVAGDKLDEDNLILKDADERSSNRYVVRILEDTHDALNVTCDLLPIEHPGRPSYTAIYAKIYAKTTLLPKSPYRVVLQATDESLLAGHGEKTLNITLTFFGPEHRTTTTTAASMSAGRRRVVSYPETVKISRISSRYSRVAAPLGKPPPSSRFSVEGSRAFGVTRTEGIVYVADRGVLKNEPATATLTVKWRAKDRVDSATIRVDLLEPSPLDAGEACRDDGNRERSGDLEDYEDDGEGKSALRSCANAETPEECESGCGVASGSLGEARANGTERFYGRCVWRWDGRSNVSRMSERYSTCSPDLAHCPDNRCDELELLNPRICPQDCVLEANLHFGEPNAGGKGIKSGMGTCACSDASRCTCNVDRFRALNVVPEDVARSGREETSRDSQNEIVVSGARKASNGPCGPICVAGVVGAGFFLLIAIVGSFATSRYRTTKKGSRREGKRRVEGEPSGIGMLPSDYVDRVAADGLLIGLDTFAAANRHLLLPKTRPPDPKWEFPRSRLTIEQVLGEGEFGRVLRAKAIDIAGIPGQTTVAVKTLKENACASELADLLSEYQLLKEVQHPNVIRLLGACTTSAGPVYLIIEFAEFGSLRNYLRRSRRLDSFSPASRNASEQDASPIIGYTVTPRDVLSFAWQICKGMAYLADIKLVHRDLAARNVLLATGKLCKISDFGLTRDVYEDDAYLKRSKGRVPVKWMAPESLADHVYTSKSDVWSFGVLLWELVTLGASPYPGVDVHNLYNLLKAGYRMERPANCSPQLYKLMVSCWHQEPASRPSFRELVAHWERMLEDGVEYLDLNPRTVHNQTYFADSLRVLDSPNSSTNGGNEENDAGDEDRKDGRDGKNGTVDSRSVSRTDVVNYLGKPFADAVTKSDKVDKLRALWPEPVVSFPEEEPPNSSSRSYVNDPARSLCPNDYESPIKFRNVSVTSNSENDLASPIATNDRPRSYMDMEGKKIPETKDLLLFPAKDSAEEDRERSDRTNHFGSFGSHPENT